MCLNYYIMNKAFVCAAHTLPSGPALNYQVKGITELKPCFTSSTYLTPEARWICPFDCPLVLWNHRSPRRFEVAKDKKKSSSLSARAARGLPPVSVAARPQWQRQRSPPAVSLFDVNSFGCLGSSHPLDAFTFCELPARPLPPHIGMMSIHSSACGFLIP